MLEAWAQRHTAAWHLYRGAAAFLALYGAGSCISFGVHIFLARTIGAASYGHFAFATNCLAILLVCSTVGLKPTVLRFAAAYLARKEWPMLRGLLQVATRWTIGASVAVVLLSAIVWIMVRPGPYEAGVTLLLVVLALPFMALGEVWSAALRGLGAVSRSQLPASIVQHLLFGIGLLVLFATIGIGGGAATAAAAFLGATVGALGVAGALLRAQFPPATHAAAPAYARRDWAGVAGDNFLISLLQATRVPLIVVIMGAQVDPRHLAYYVAAARLANVTVLGLTGISGMATPQIARHFALSDPAELQRVAYRAARGSLACASVVAAALAVFGRPLLGLFGTGFESAFVPLLVLMTGELVAAAAGPVGYFLTMTGQQRTATAIEALSSVLAVGLAIVLIPAYGIVGTAWVVTLAGTLRNVMMVVAVQRYLGVRSAVV